MHTRTTIIRALAIVLINLAVLELASFGAVHALSVVSPNRRLDLFVDAQLQDVTTETLDSYFSGGYDAELGWDNVPSAVVTQRNVLDRPWTASYDAGGARQSCVGTEIKTAPPFIATYGDSFTRGDEVNDDQTWQCEIERRIERRIANFGVGGYDVGQALLKAERHWAEGAVAPVTILCVYSDDLARVLNRYRPFLDGASAGKLGFKPSFRALNGTVSLLPNPLRNTMTTREDIRTLAITVAPADFWAQRWARVLPQFPYSLQIIRTGWYAIESRVGTPPYAINAWDTREGREVMLYLLRRFVTGAQRRQTRAILLLIPDVNAWRDGRRASAYDRFLREDLASAKLDLDVVDVAATPFDEHRFSLKPFEGHASVYGNEIIASALLQHLAATTNSGAASR